MPSLFFFLPLPFFLSGQSVVRRQYEAKLTLGCRVCCHDYAKEIPDLVHPTWHDIQLFISRVSRLVSPQHISCISLWWRPMFFCFAVFYWSERCVLTVLQNVKAGLWGCFSCVLWQDNLSGPLRQSAHYPHTPTTHAADAIALNVTVWKRRTSVRAHN